MAFKNGVQYDSYYTGRWIAGEASTKGHLDILQYYHEELGEDITYDRNRLVRLAAFNGHLSTVQYLVKHGSVITAKQV